MNKKILPNIKKSLCDSIWNPKAKTFYKYYNNENALKSSYPNVSGWHSYIMLMWLDKIHFNSCFFNERKRDSWIEDDGWEILTER